MEPQTSLTDLAAKMDQALAELTGARKVFNEARERIAGLEVEIQQLTDQFNAAKAAVVNAEPSVIPQ